MPDTKKCPDCGMLNQVTNIFCPTCGHCFIEETEKPGEAASTEPGKEKKEHRLLKGITVGVIIVLALTAGLASYLVSMEIERSRMVVVETGTVWKCSECGSIYKKRVAEVEVKKTESDKYGVETVEGVCFDCEYGPEVGRFQRVLEELSEPETPLGSTVEIEPEAALFISEHLDLFPAADVSRVSGIAVEEDPRLLERDFERFAGKPVHATGNVAASEVIDVSDGTEVTYIRLIPVTGGRELGVEFLIVYRRGRLLPVACRPGQVPVRRP